jgi:UMF1 family MFS transporter
VIVLSLAALVALGAGVLMVERARWFWILALALGIFIGPAQSASRTLMARLAPSELQAEMFGLYALTGKITAFIGPALYGWATAYFQSQRAGMASVVAFLLLGLLLVLPVREGR